MTISKCFIIASNGDTLHTGKDLAVIFRGARNYDGVRAVEIERIEKHYPNQVLRHYRGGARVTIRYQGRCYGVCNFVSYSHAVEWAHEKSGRKGTYWTGCEVIEK